jgi:CheY-like chemotaxis protein
VPKKVLVVDEERFVARLARVNLQRAGFEVVVAHDSGEALQKVETEKPDVIFLGPTLPFRADVIRTLKANPSTRNILVVGVDCLLPPRT